MGFSSLWPQDDDDAKAGEDGDGEDGSDEEEEVETGEDVGCAWR